MGSGMMIKLTAKLHFWDEQSDVLAQICSFSEALSFETNRFLSNTISSGLTVHFRISAQHPSLVEFVGPQICGQYHARTNTNISTARSFYSEAQLSLDI